MINKNQMLLSTAKIILILIIMTCVKNCKGMIMDLQIIRATADTEVDHKKETNLTTASASYTLVGRSMGGGEGDVPSSSDGLPNVGNGVADILFDFYSFSVLVGVSGIVTANAEAQLLFCIFFTCSKHLQIEPKQ